MLYFWREREKEEGKRLPHEDRVRNGKLQLAKETREKKKKKCFSHLTLYNNKRSHCSSIIHPFSQSITLHFSPLLTPFFSFLSNLSLPPSLSLSLSSYILKFDSISLSLSLIRSAQHYEQRFVFLLLIVHFWFCFSLYCSFRNLCFQSWVVA